MFAANLRRPIVFNTTGTDDQISLFILRETSDWRGLASAAPALRNARHNCLALAKRVVVCDQAVLSKGASALLNRPATRADARAFGRWAVGHELGHLATGSEGLHQAPAITARDLRQQRREYAADCWMLNNLSTPVQEQIALERLAIDIISAHFTKTEAGLPAGVGILFDYNRADPYTFTSAGSHPDIILRATRLLHVAATRRNDANLHALMRPFVDKLTPDPLWPHRGPCA
jgi:hypothetical protein